MLEPPSGFAKGNWRRTRGPPCSFRIPQPWLVVSGLAHGAEYGAGEVTHWDPGKSAQTDSNSSNFVANLVEIPWTSRRVAERTTTTPGDWLGPRNCPGWIAKFFFRSARRQVHAEWIRSRAMPVHVHCALKYIDLYKRPPREPANHGHAQRRDFRRLSSNIPRPIYCQPRSRPCALSQRIES